ncbi:MAG: 30S ribosomal protein S21 [bacterium]|jgi:small subunit ribosomal protein S21
MLIVEIKNGESLERALKTLKSKVIKTKQNKILFQKKHYEKKSVERRNQIQKAIYTQKVKNSQ